MDYLIPDVLPYEFLKSLGISIIEQIEVDPSNDSRLLECYNNVSRYIQLNQGEAQFGWSFSQLGNIAIKLTGHVVVKLPDGSLKCVTPSEHKVSKIYFSPDSSILSSIVDNRLPAKVFALVDDDVINQFVKLENQQNKMRLEGNEAAVRIVMHYKYQLSSKLKVAFDAYS